MAVVYNEVTEGCEWVIQGEGIATRKWDGTCCLIRGGQVYKRYDAKVYIPSGTVPEVVPTTDLEGVILSRGLALRKPLPPGFEPADVPDAVTGHWPGWLLVDPNKPEDRWHAEAMRNDARILDKEGTYELCGPKIGGNPENLQYHTFIRHGEQIETNVPHTFSGLSEFLKSYVGEGIVWHHPDGRMAKLRRKDFRTELVKKES